MELDSHLTVTFLATTECPSWIGAAPSSLPTITSHFAFFTGANRALMPAPRAAISPDWHALAVAPTSLSSASTQGSLTTSDAYPQSFLMTPVSFGSLAH